MTLKSYFYPSSVKKYECPSYSIEINGVELENVSLAPEFFAGGAPEFFADAFSRLKKMKLPEIIEQLDTASRKFLDPSYDGRKKAIEAISKITGFSVDSVALSIDLEFSSSLKEGMHEAVLNEFGGESIFDGFVRSKNGSGRSKALPAGPVFAVSSSNIPALPHLSIMRSFITKNPVIVKTSFDEPVFTPIYMQALKDAGSELCECAMVVCYKNSDNRELTEKLVGVSNIIIAYGGDEAEKYFSGAVKHPKRLIMHPHRLGFGVIGGDFIGCAREAEIHDLASKISFDVAAFEQRACLAPHVYFYSKKNNPPVSDFIKALLMQMQECERKISPATLSDNERHSRRIFIDGLSFSENVIEFYETDSKNSLLIHSRIGEFPISPLNRALYLVEYENINEVLEILKPVSRYLQNASLNVVSQERERWLDSLSELGVSRICPAGSMPSPSMRWRHDGIGALIAMAKFCDIEGVD